MNLRLILALVVAAILASCSKKQQAPLTPDKIERNGWEYFKPLLSDGETTTNIIAMFGQPAEQYQTGNHELRMDFPFYPPSHRKAYSMGVGGFTAFFTNNCLSRWVPIYITGPPLPN